MARIIIHGGTGKTGSTSIQTALAQNQQALAALGIRSLVSNRTNNTRSTKHRIAWRDSTDISWVRLREELDQIKDTDDTFILSNENVFSLRDDHLEHFASQFEGFDVAVLVYVREQTDYLQTLLLQHQKRENKQIDLTDRRQIQAWIDRRIDSIDYHRMAERMEKTFGTGTFHARVFDRELLINKDLLADFFACVGITDTSSLNLSTHTNSSLNPKYASVVRERSEQLTKDFRYSEVLDLAVRSSKNDDSPRWFLSEEEVTEIRERFEESNRLFFAQYVRNGGAFRQKDTHVKLVDLDWDSAHIAEQMIREMKKWPQLNLKGWNGKAGSAKKLFRDGWTVYRTIDNVHVSKASDTASVRFRLPESKMGQWTENALTMTFTLAGDPQEQDVAINGTPVGKVSLGEEGIVIPFDLLGDIDEAEVSLTDTTGSQELLITSMDVELTQIDS